MYALNDEVKDLFFDQLRAVTAGILVSYRDWNRHVCSAGTGYRGVHGGMGYGRPEPDVEVEYALAFDLLLRNTFQEM